MSANVNNKFKVSKLPANFGAEITGLDGLNPLDPETISAIRQVLADNVVIVVRGQDFEQEQLVNFSRQFGDLEVFFLKEHNADRAPEVYMASNVGQDGKILPRKHSNMERQKIAFMWHTDMSWKQIPSAYSILFGYETTRAAGETLLMNMYDVYEALPNSLRKKIEGRRALHSQQNLFRHGNMRQLTEEERAKVPAVWHPIVCIHPVTKRKCIFLSPINIEQIEGLSPEETDKLIEEIIQFGSQDRFVYKHTWQPKDILIWDNRCSLHRAADYDPNERRVLYRTTVTGEAEMVAA